MLEMMHGQETANATEKPCQVCRSHVPKVLVTQGHHRFPKFMQSMIWGKIMMTHPRFPELVYLCPTLHMNVHFGISQWFVSGVIPAHLPKHVFQLVDYAVKVFTDNGGQRNIPIAPVTPNE